MDLREELKTAGTYPTGPCSAWPQARHEALMLKTGSAPKQTVKASVGDMAKGLVKVAGQAVRNGRVSEEIRNERYDTCKGCPAFIKDSKRCSECGCFMESKTWIGGDPNTLCPLKKWSN